jgi:hypothetical protein
MSFDGLTENEGVFSWWKGQHAIQFVPFFFSVT